MTPRIPPALGELLSRSPSETTPWLLELARRQAGRRRPADLVRQYLRDGFVAPSALDQRVLHRLDGLALEAAVGFEALQLAPVAPLGTCSVVAPSAQDRTLSTLRGTEVVSDPTNVLALECARRLASCPSDRVRLCTVHQVLRAQPLPDRPGFSRHFRLFALAEAGRGAPGHGFEVEAIVRHVQVFDRIFDACAEVGCQLPARRAVLFSAASQRALSARAHERLARTLPHARIDEESFESKYYAGVRVLYGAEANDGAFVPLGDTGVFDWVARLTSNRRLRFVASGLGTQLLPLLFATRGCPAS